MGLKESIERLLEDKGEVYPNSEVEGKCVKKPEINPHFLKAALQDISNRLKTIEEKVGKE